MFRVLAVIAWLVFFGASVYGAFKPWEPHWFFMASAIGNGVLFALFLLLKGVDLDLLFDILDLIFDLFD